MIGFFFAILFSNHWVVVCFVSLLQVLSFRELIGVRYKEVKEQQIPWFRSLSWFAFSIVEFSAYGARVMRALGLGRYLHYHGIISFAAFVAYFALFVLSLKKKKLYKYQIMQAAWTWMVLLIVVGQAWGTWSNIFNGGIFWFLLPASLIVCNDIWAYFSGLMFGRRFIQRQFLALSPNKTWEGFIGGFIVTLLLSPIQVYLYQIPDFWVCPAGVPHCVRHAAFLPATYSVFGQFSFSVAPIYIHGIVFAVFASLIAPFGGFFASGVKRAFGKKDFDSLFPGHGGVVDRLDCQMIMQLFVWIFLRTWVLAPLTGIAGVLAALQTMDKADQLAVLAGLQSMLK